MHAAHGLANFIVGGRGYGAGVEDDQGRVGGGRGGGEPLRGQAGFNGGSVGLGGGAAEVFLEKSIPCFKGSWRRAGQGHRLFGMLASVRMLTHGGSVSQRKRAIEVWGDGSASGSVRLGCVGRSASGSVRLSVCGSVRQRKRAIEVWGIGQRAEAC